VSLPGQKDKFTPELRILVASLLSVGVILLWAKFFGRSRQLLRRKQIGQRRRLPQRRAPRRLPRRTHRRHPRRNNDCSGRAIHSRSKKRSQERTVVIENDLYRVEISNRGAVVKSWQLKKYQDDAKPRRVLDVVHPEAAQQTGGCHSRCSR